MDKFGKCHEFTMNDLFSNFKISFVYDILILHLKFELIEKHIYSHWRPEDHYKSEKKTLATSSYCHSIHIPVMSNCSVDVAAEVIKTKYLTFATASLKLKSRQR